MNEEKKCLRCGQCCEGCKHLRFLPGKNVLPGIPKHFCSIWKRRNKDIASGHPVVLDGHVCLPRKFDNRIFEGCPLNPDIS